MRSRIQPAVQTTLRSAVVLIAVVVAAPIVQAGITAENVIVVVNGKSAASRTIANHYVEARAIPDANVVILPAVPDDLKVSLNDFKTRILGPTLKAIDDRGLSLAGTRDRLLRRLPNLG